MGAIDAQGIWVYDNTDQMIPLATFMNLGQNSVSDAIEDVRTDLTPAVLDAALSTSGGTSGSTSQQWVRGGVAGVMFSFVTGSATNGTTIATLAAPYRPPWTVGVPLAGNSPTHPTSVFALITTAGAVTLQFYGTAPVSTLTFRGVGSWPKV